MIVLFAKFTRRIRGVAEWFRKVEVQWVAPQSSDIVIFEITNIDYLLPLCGHAKVMSLEVPVRTVHLCSGVVLGFTRLLLRGISFKAAYLAALIRNVKPSIVVTFIDNSELFYQVARAGCPGTRFLAIQNAARYDVLEMTSEAASRVFIPEFACFGDYEKDLYSGKGAHVGHFYPVGSLREAYFRSYRKNIETVEHAGVYDYDLCVVAEASPGWDETYPGFEDAIGRIAQYAIRLAREKGLQLVIAGKRDASPIEKRSAIHLRDAELIWYEKYIGGDVPITPRVRDQFTTYGLISRSRLSLAMVSTALREGAGRGCRVLFCNFSGNRLWDFCVDGIWSLKEDSYEAFSERVMHILALTDKEYASQAESMARYVINNDDQNPTNAFLERLIASAVAGA